MLDTKVPAAGRPRMRGHQSPTDHRSDSKAADEQELVICPRSGWIGIDWEEMWSHRELLDFLVWRDISVRYKQTILGPAWAILQPLMMMVIFTMIFGRFAGIDSEGLPYPVFVFAGLIPWSLFSQGMAQSALSLVNQQQMLTKVYFPRLFVPIAAASVFLVDLLISLAIYAVVMLVLWRDAELGDPLAGAPDPADARRHAGHRRDARRR